MPITFPRAVRDVWGEEVADEVARVLDETFQRRAVSRDEHREVISRLDVIDQRFEQVDQRFEQMEAKFEQRFEGIENELAAQRRERGEMHRDIDARFDTIHERFDRQAAQFDGRLDAINEAMRRQTRWTIGTIALFGTIMTVLLAIAQFTA